MEARRRRTRELQKELKPYIRRGGAAVSIDAMIAPALRIDDILAPPLQIDDILAPPLRHIDILAPPLRIDGFSFCFCLDRISMTNLFVTHLHA